MGQKNKGQTLDVDKMYTKIRKDEQALDRQNRAMGDEVCDVMADKIRELERAEARVLELKGEIHSLGGMIARV